VRPKFSVRSNKLYSLIRRSFSAPRASLAEAIRKCWQHSAFDIELCFSEEIETDFVPLEEPDGWESFTAGLPFTVFLECDRDVAICGKRTYSEIVAEVTGLWDHSDSEHSEEETEEESAPPSPQWCNFCLGNFKRLPVHSTNERSGWRVHVADTASVIQAGVTRRKLTALDSFLSKWQICVTAAVIC